MSDIETRVAVLEQHRDYHERELARLEKESQSMNVKLTAIQSNLSQIKWCAYGAAFVLFADKAGILGAFKEMAL